jgi:membrane fusion protein (multidrug efflux system)
MTKRIVFSIIGLILVVVVVLRVLQASASTEIEPDVPQLRQTLGVPVEVVPATIGPIVVRREFTGTLGGIRSATVRARTRDEIVDIPVRVGQRVEERDVLVRQSSQGSAASVEQARAAKDQAQRTVDRLRPLREEGAVSDQDWDNAMTALRVAEANLQVAQRAITLTSPIAGVVTDILETVGAFPDVSDPLVRVSDLSRLRLTFDVSPEQARELSVGQQGTLSGYGIEGRLSRIALQADPESRLLEVELTFPGMQTSTEARRVVPGGLVTAEVIVGRHDSALCIPRIAQREGVVWVVDGDGSAHARSVQFGLSGDGLVEVLEGLVEGEQVVVAGASLLTEGVKTRIISSSTANVGS